MFSMTTNPRHEAMFFFFFGLRVVASLPCLFSARNCLVRLNQTADLDNKSDLLFSEKTYQVLLSD